MHGNVKSLSRTDFVRDFRLVSLHCAVALISDVPKVSCWNQWRRERRGAVHRPPPF